VRFDSDAPLEAGMVLSVEAYYSTPEFKYANEEAVAVTENGFEWLSVPDDGIFTCGTGL
jgi:Xaa-Pro aminopeptidase